MTKNDMHFICLIAICLKNLKLFVNVKYTFMLLINFLDSDIIQVDYKSVGSTI